MKAKHLATLASSLVLAAVLAGPAAADPKEGGRANVVIQPEPPGLMAVWEAFVESYRRLGNDPLVGRRLVALLHRAGAAPRRATFVHFGACAGDPSFPAFASNLLENLRGARGAILETGLVDGPALDAALLAFTAFAARPDAVIWYAMPWAEGVRPG